MSDRRAPLAIFDSGVGGLSVLRHLRSLLPHEDLLYLADQAHVPYGPRPALEVRAFVEAITRFFLQQQAKLVVVACNTATAAALVYLRRTFPQLPFVGMEPAVKPGAAQTRSGRVGVLATAGTFESQRYASLMARFAQDVTLFENPCSGLVQLVEAGALQESDTEQLLRRCLEPMLDAGVDTVVLGCTHYPFVLPLIETISGPGVTVIDPAPAVARQTQRLLEQHQLTAPAGRSGRVQAYTTGSAQHFARLASRLLGYAVPVTALRWQAGALHPVTERLLSGQE